MKKVKCCNPTCSTRFKPTGQQRRALKKDRAAFCSVECRMVIYAAQRRNSYIKKILSPKECKFCDSMFMPNKPNQQYCSPQPGRNGCQYEAQKERMRGKNVLKKIRHPSALSRRCKLCDQDAYPNYYFCPGCHSTVGDNNILEEHSVSIWR